MRDGDRKGNKPNILFIMVDEWRYPVEYESEELKEWKRKNLKFREVIESKGTVFHRHYTNTTACSPSRTTMQTGQYPNVHGVTQTDGIAKNADDPEMVWLEPWTVPTMGNYFREYGYKTVIKGKWHISDSSITLRDGSKLTTFDSRGNTIEKYKDFYLEKNVLGDYGYDGWIGPEPHGSASLNSASSLPKNVLGRDIKFTEQLIQELEDLSETEDPWFLLATYLDPHDITVYGWDAITSDDKWRFEVDPTLPETLFTREFNESLNEYLATKPPAQESYRNLYSTAIQPIMDIDRYQRYYYTLQRRVDEKIMRLWNKLISLPCYENTLVIFTSDHGDQLGSHGRMFQKWYQAYEESIHIPLVVSSPLLGNEHRDVNSLTCHIDILPTLLDMAGANSNKLRLMLGKSPKRGRRSRQPFSLNLPLSGVSIKDLVTGESEKVRDSIYFYTEDDPISGENQRNIQCRYYTSVSQPSSVEAVLLLHKNRLWKLTHYYAASNPCSNVKGISHELYNVTDDPMELTNLFGRPKYAKIQGHLMKLLDSYKIKYRSVDPDDFSQRRSCVTTSQRIPGSGDVSECGC